MDLEKFTKQFTDFADANAQRFEGVAQRVDGLDDKLRAHAGEIAALKTGREFGGWYSESSAERAKEAFAAYLRKGDVAAMADVVPPHLKAMSEGGATDGGAAVPLEIDALIAKKARDVNVIRQLASVVQIGSQSYKKLISTGGTGAAWAAEDGARAASATPTLQGVTIAPGDLFANAFVTQWLLDDVNFDLGAWLTSEIGEQFGAAEQTAFVTGNGTNQPKGFLAATTSTSADGARTFGQVQVIHTGVSGALPATDAAIYDLLTDVFYALRTKYRANASWLMASATLALLMKVKDDNKRPIFSDAVAGQPPTLLGRPVYTCEAMPVLAANSLSIALGDFRQAYQIVDRIGTRVLRDPFTNKPNVGFYVSRRIGGSLVDDDALKIIKAAT